MVKTIAGRLHCADIFRNKWEDGGEGIRTRESIYAIFLNAHQEAIFFDQFNIGNHAKSCYDIRTVLRYGLNIKAEYIAIAHNHIHGNPNPSKTDIEVTKLIVQVLDLLDISLYDHVILTANSHFSFRDSGLLDEFRNGR